MRDLAAPAPLALPSLPLLDAVGARAARLGRVVLWLGLVVVLGWIGLTKFTAEEARAIVPLLSHSPLLAWMLDALGTRGASNAIGVAELATVALLALRPWAPRLAALGAAAAVGTFVVTLSFLLTTPGTVSLAHGVPLPDGPASFLIKDLVLLGASLWALGDALRR